MSYKLIDEHELKLLKSKSELTMIDLEAIMWEKSSIIRYLRNIQNTYRVRLANLQAVGKEWEVYMAIKTIEEMIVWIEGLKDEINKIKEQEKNKEKK
jgi:hypothetical protein